MDTPQNMTPPPSLLPLTDEELASYKQETTGFWANCWLYGDGYDVAERAQKRGWNARASWGSDGWDLGSWPYVMIFTQTYEDGTFGLASYCEGDVTLYRFPTQAHLSAALDALAFWYWKHDGEDWVKDIATAQDMPQALRGPYRPS